METKISEAFAKALEIMANMIAKAECPEDGAKRTNFFEVLKAEMLRVASPEKLFNLFLASDCGNNNPYLSACRSCGITTRLAKQTVLFLRIDPSGIGFYSTGERKIECLRYDGCPDYDHIKVEREEQIPIPESAIAREYTNPDSGVTEKVFIFTRPLILEDPKAEIFLTGVCIYKNRLRTVGELKNLGMKPIQPSDGAENARVIKSPEPAYLCA